jgi:hypothetical protein
MRTAPTAVSGWQSAEISGSRMLNRRQRRILGMRPILASVHVPAKGTLRRGRGLLVAQRRNVRWISIGLRCLTDNTPGVYADWKINYGPSGHLLSRHSRISLQHATTQDHDLRLEY